MGEENSIYRTISSFEPLIPELIGNQRLAELGAEILSTSGQLCSILPSEILRKEIAGLVREMNCYYSNLIEGHRTLPHEIKSALNQDFSESKEERRNQELSVAHIRTEVAMRERLSKKPDTDIHATEFIGWIHQQFYQHLPKSEWVSESKNGKKHPLKPGEIRDHNVIVGRHIPPDFPTIPDFLQRFHTVYGSGKRGRIDHLIAIAAAHHRLVWVHPFSDGNGRVGRLHSQAGMILGNVDANGLWTLSRGFAREKSSYFAALQRADQERANDFDGRGNLSNRALIAWCDFFLTQALDQITFMSGLIAPLSLVDRIQTYIRFNRTDLESKTRDHFSRLLKALCLEGELSRGAVAGVLGLKSTAARTVIKKIVADGLVQSPSEKGPLRLAFPTEVVEFYFPGLFVNLPEN